MSFKHSQGSILRTVVKGYDLKACAKQAQVIFYLFDFKFFKTKLYFLNSVRFIEKNEKRTQ